MDRDDEHSPSTLRHSEVASVENPVGPPVPEFAQATEERPKIAASIRGEESRYVLEDDRGRSASLHKVEEGVGEPGSGVEPVGVGAHASALPGDAEVLARKTACPEEGVVPVRTAITFDVLTGIVSLALGAYSEWPCCQSNTTGEVDNAPEVGDSGPSLREDGTGVRVDLGEADGSPAGSLEPQIESADA